MCEVEVWAGGQNLTPVDTSAYLPSFIHAMRADESLLCDEERVFEQGANLLGLTAKQAFECISQSPEAWSKLRVLNWGETTDDVLCFLVPVQDKIHLAWMELPSRTVHSLPVITRELAGTLRRARHMLISFSGRPNA
jgi:hypothetical protein